MYLHRCYSGNQVKLWSGRCATFDFDCVPAHSAPNHVWRGIHLVSPWVEVLMSPGPTYHQAMREEETVYKLKGYRYLEHSIWRCVKVTYKSWHKIMSSNSKQNKNYRHAQGVRIEWFKQDVCWSLRNVVDGDMVMIQSREAQMFVILQEALKLGQDSGMVEMAEFAFVWRSSWFCLWVCFTPPSYSCVGMSILT